MSSPEASATDVIVDTPYLCYGMKYESVFAQRTKQVSYEGLVGISPKDDFSSV